MSYHCPQCNGVIYNRRNKLCGFCGAELPAELLFTPAEIEVLNREEAEANARHKDQLAKEQAEAEAKARARVIHGPFLG